MLLAKYLRLLVLSLFITGCNNDDFNGESSASSSDKTTTLNFSSVAKWPNSNFGQNGISLHVSDEVLEEFNNNEEAIQGIYNTWNNAISSKNLINPSFRTITNLEPNDLEEYGSDNVFGIYKSNSWFADQDRFALAITQYFGIRDSEGILDLIHGDIILNFSESFTFFTNPEEASFEDYDLNSILLHEIGHFLGLGHQGFRDQSVMRPTLQPLTTERSLYPLDVDAISDLYDSSSSSSSSSLAIVASGLKNAKPSHSRKPSTVVRGVIKLMANGDCKHYENDKLVHKHKISDIKK